MSKSVWSGIVPEDIIRMRREEAMSRITARQELFADELEEIAQKHYEVEHEVDYDDYGRPVYFDRIWQTDAAKEAIIRALESYTEDIAADYKIAHS